MNRPKKTAVPSATDSESRYAVGYKKPPVHTQFKPGKSGNPKGRPRGGGVVRSTITEMLTEPTAYTENGKRRTAPVLDLLFKRAKNAALQGEFKPLFELLKFCEKTKLIKLSDLVKPATQRQIEVTFVEPLPGEEQDAMREEIRAAHRERLKRIREGEED